MKRAVVHPGPSEFQRSLKEHNISILESLSTNKLGHWNYPPVAVESLKLP